MLMSTSANCCACGEPATEANPRGIALSSTRQHRTIWWHNGCDASPERGKFLADESLLRSQERSSDSPFEALAFLRRGARGRTAGRN
jgi:hypothetical protein